MYRLASIALVLAILLALLPGTAAAQVVPGCTESRIGGSQVLICVPPTWNGDLVIFAHGYVAPNEPIGIPWSQLSLSDGTFIPYLINSQGYAFATTSYSKNGLAVKEGVNAVTTLASLFRQRYPSTSHVYLIGASEGGLVATLAVEQRPSVFSGGVSACAPIGDFRTQINYFGDFRVVFDYLFPGVLPPSPVSIPASVMSNWGTLYAPTIAARVGLDPGATAQLLLATGAATDPGNPSSALPTTLGVLWYNVFATNDAREQLRGQPFDNTGRPYLGSAALNIGVQRFRADQSAIAQMNAHYQTTGRLQVPLVVIHTTWDPIVPYWHKSLYDAKVQASGSSPLYDSISVPRYGHCNFTPGEMLAAFGLMLSKTAQVQSVP